MIKIKSIAKTIPFFFFLITPNLDLYVVEESFERDLKTLIKVSNAGSHIYFMRPYKLLIILLDSLTYECYQ